MRGGDRVDVLDDLHPVDDIGEKAGFDPLAPDAFDASGRMIDARHAAVGPVSVEHRARRIRHADAGTETVVARIAPDRRGRPAGARAADDPARHRMRFAGHLGKDRFGDIVVAAPVGRAFGIGELVDVMALQIVRQRLGGRIDLTRRVYEMAFAAVEGDRVDLGLRGAARNHCDETQAQHAREIGFGHGGRAARCLDHRSAFADPAVAQAIKEQRPGKPVLEAAGRMARLVLEIDRDIGQRGNRQRYEMRVGGSVEIGLDAADGPVHPLARVRHGGLLPGKGRR